MFREEKKMIHSWWWWGLGMLVATGIILTGLSYAGLIGRTHVERVVFKNSHQYKEARNSAIGMYEAQLSQIEIQLTNPDLDPSTRTNLMAQKSALNVQLQAERSKL